MRIYLNIEQHETDNPTVTIYSPSVLELTGTRDSKGVYTLTSENPIFTEGTGVFTTRQDYLTDLSSGDLYGSRVDDYNIKLINWGSVSGFPEDEVNNIKILIAIP